MRIAVHLWMLLAGVGVLGGCNDEQALAGAGEEITEEVRAEFGDRIWAAVGPDGVTDTELRLKGDTARYFHRFDNVLIKGPWHARRAAASELPDSMRQVLVSHDAAGPFYDTLPLLVIEDAAEPGRIRILGHLYFDERASGQWRKGNGCMYWMVDSPQDSIPWYTGHCLMLQGPAD